jgi:hypothetical protein
MRRKLRGKLTYANVMVTILTFVVLGGGAYAAFKVPPNSVGTRQLKAKAVTAGKIANGTITGAKVAESTLSGANIDLSALGTVPQSAHSDTSSEAAKVGGHSAECPQHTTLIRGLCFDTSSSEAPNVVQASEACAGKGGWLPTPLQLYSTKTVLNLGTGTGTDKTFTDDIYNKPGEADYRTIVIDGAGALEEEEITAAAHYICVYPLVR